MASILIVDDDALLRELLRVHLTGAGYEVNVAADAMEAGRVVLRAPPDLIISDVNMPYMDGLEFISALKADATLPNIPVIFLTGEKRDHRSRSHGVVEYLMKPVRADLLLALVAKHLRDGRHPIG